MANLKLAWHDIYETLPNQSNFHNNVVNLLRGSDTFSKMKIYQEVPVISLVPKYKWNQHRYDIYIATLDVILELHGKQHYVATAFGSMSYEEKMKQFREIQFRDSAKKQAALESGYSYKEIPWNLKLDTQTITKIILED